MGKRERERESEKRQMNKAQRETATTIATSRYLQSDCHGKCQLCLQCYENENDDKALNITASKEISHLIVNGATL